MTSWQVGDLAVAGVLLRCWRLVPSTIKSEGPLADLPNYPLVEANAVRIPINPSRIRVFTVPSGRLSS
jgi:hypothetical protein